MRALAAVVIAVLTACVPRAPGPVVSPASPPATAGVRATGQPLVLTAIPKQATIAWVEPRVLIADATTEDNESATLGAVRSMRLDVEALLKNEQWTFVTGDTAQYLATVALTRRTVQREERRVVPGTENLPRRCDSTRTGGVCTQPPPQYTTVRVPFVETRAAFAVLRRADGARFEHVVSHIDARTSGGVMVKQLIALMQAR